MATTTIEHSVPEPQARTLVKKHHLLVRITHWLNIPLLIGMTFSGFSIYWAAPVYKHAPVPFTYIDPSTKTPTMDTSDEYLSDIGIWVCHHVPFLHHYPTPQNWFYDHFSLGTGLLASALQIHWLFAYLFMLNGLVYLVGLGLGGGYKALLPRRTDLAQGFQMVRYYLGLLPAKLLRRPWPHPVITTKYNALQRSAYFAMPIFGGISVLTGWAMHKPMQLGWLQGLFGGYDLARIFHFWLVFVFASFVIPHVILVIADGWDTFRSMVVGWSARVPAAEHGAPKN